MEIFTINKFGATNSFIINEKTKAKKWKIKDEKYFGQSKYRKCPTCKFRMICQLEKYHSENYERSISKLFNWKNRCPEFKNIIKNIKKTNKETNNSVYKIIKKNGEEVLVPIVNEIGQLKLEKEKKIYEEKSKIKK